MEGTYIYASQITLGDKTSILRSAPEELSKPIDWGRIKMLEGEVENTYLSYLYKWAGLMTTL